ncbi:hypothetical protein Pyn_34635 [Prunus yedoensis var. nudiflora]|uniref:Uncharacterized protein n=1 Tax=Prunus yedoensis var. nudiflora TaxID=2094558 RepID=A0A314Z3M0_PRUYE|nr:hypothetical protein Pyn_34635 [Prunus yedoensis var. nudiflora]
MEKEEENSVFKWFKEGKTYINTWNWVDVKGTVLNLLVRKGQIVVYHTFTGHLILIALTEWCGVKILDDWTVGRQG